MNIQLADRSITKFPCTLHTHSSVVMNCAGLALSTFTSLYITRLKEIEEELFPMSYKEYMLKLINIFNAKFPNLAVRVLSNEQELKDTEDLVLFRIEIDEDLEEVEHTFRFLDYHFIRKHNGLYFSTFHTILERIDVTEEPNWSQYVGETLLLATNTRDIFSDFLQKECYSNYYSEELFIRRMWGSRERASKDESFERFMEKRVDKYNREDQHAEAQPEKQEVKSMSLFG